MRKKKETGMTISSLPRPEGPAWMAEAARLVPAALVLLGIFGVLCCAWNWQTERSVWLAPAAGIAAIAAAQWLLRAKKDWKLAGLAALAVCTVLFCLVFAARVQSAAAAAMNDVLAFLERRGERIYLRFAQGSAAGKLWALGPACVLLGALLALAAAYAPYMGMAALGAVWLGCMTGILEPSLWLLALTFGAVWMLLEGNGQENPAAQLQGLAAGSVLTLLAALALGLSGLGKSWDASALCERAGQALHALRYEADEQAMPEGNFRKAGQLQQTQRQMLQITMSEPESLYLRSYVGQRYTPTGWTAADAEALAQNAQAFYWLHQTPFYAQSQLSTLAQSLGFEIKDISVTQTLTGACREHIPVPYELQDKGALLDSLQNGDGLPKAGGLFGQKTAQYRTSGNLTGKAYALLDALQQHLDDPALSGYIEAEGNYRSYVYDTYLTIPEKTAQTLAEFLGPTSEHMTSFEAKQRILACLDENVSYSEAVPQLPGDADFTSYFLRELGRGNAVHYATAAAMMLRYFGIPARYVEGYLITPDAVAGKEGQTTLTLRASDAHAWAEYYEDGVGWIPFEATPPYRGVMEESDWLWFNQEQNAALQSSESQSGQLGGGQSQSLRPQAQVENQEQLQQQTQMQQGASAEQTANRRRLALWIWLMILLLLLLAAVVYLIMRRKAVLKKRNEAFSQDDNRAASAALFAHSMQMMWASGLPRENIPVERMQQVADAWREDAEFAQAAQIHTLARYSSHEITPEQRDVLLQFELQAQQKFIGKLRWYQKLYQKWIRCMY